MRNLVFIDTEQGSDDWHRLRASSLGSSEVGIAAGHGVTRDKLLVSKVVEHATGYKEEGYCSSWMSRGIQLEDMAADWLSGELCLSLSTIGMIKNNLFAGAHTSVDRLVSGEYPPRWIEIKCPSLKVHKDYLEKWNPVSGWLPSAYEWQCLSHRVILGTGGWFCSYHPECEVQLVSIIPPPNHKDIEKYKAVLDRWNKDFVKFLPQANRLEEEMKTAKRVEEEKDATLIDAARKKLKIVLKR